MRSVALLITIMIGSDAVAAPPITAAALVPDHKQVLLGSQQGVEAYSWPEVQVVSKLATNLVNVHDLAFSPNGRILAVAGGTPGEAGIVDLLSWPEGRRMRRLAGHTDVVYRIAWSPDGTRCVTAAADGLCQTFVVDSGESLIRYQEHSRAVSCIAFLPDGQTVASAGIDQTLRLWNAETGKHLRTLDNHVGPINGLAVRPVTEGKSPPIVATISEDYTVRLWQPTIGRLMRFARLPSIPRAAVWSTAGDELYVASNDGQVRILNAGTLETMETIAAMDGRIYELLVDHSAHKLLLAGEAGCRSLTLTQRNK